MVDQAGPGKLVGEGAALQPAMVDGFHVDGDDVGLGRGAADIDHVGGGHGDGSADVELGGAGVEDDDVGVILLKDGLDGGVPDGVSGDVEEGFPGGVDDEAGDGPHEVAEEAAAMFSARAGEVETVHFGGGCDGQDVGEVCFLEGGLIGGLADEGELFGEPGCGNGIEMIEVGMGGDDHIGMQQFVDRAGERDRRVGGGGCSKGQGLQGVGFSQQWIDEDGLAGQFDLQGGMADQT